MKKTLDQLVDLRTSAIIVIDMQNDFCDANGAGAKYGADVSTIQDMIPRMQRFFDGARALGAQLIFVQCIHEPSTDSDTWLFRHDGVPRPHCRKGTWGADFCGVAPQGTEPVVIKHRYSAFIGTRFESVLKTLGIRTLIMTGVGTNVCVEFDRARRIYARLQHRISLRLYGDGKFGGARSHPSKHRQFLWNDRDLR